LQATDRYDKCLGLPALVGKSRMNAFQSIKDRVWKRLQNWNNKFLFQAGKEIILKAVIQTIPTYSMSVFQLPITLCKSSGGGINKILSRFIG
jgi:muconolactone delta-isomerase